MRGGDEAKTLDRTRRRTGTDWDGLGWGDTARMQDTTPVMGGCPRRDGEVKRV